MTLNPKQRRTKKTLRIAREISNRFRASTEQIKFKILVWGPGSKAASTRNISDKRRQIRDRLNAMGMEATFSEEISVDDEQGKPLPFDLSEMFQAQVADLVINIAASPGSLLEAQQISSKLAYRCLLFLPVAAKGGFASALAGLLENLGLPPLYFDDSDVKSCVLTLVSEDWVQGLRTAEITLEMEQKLIEEMRILKGGRTLQ